MPVQKCLETYWRHHIWKFLFFLSFNLLCWLFLHRQLSTQLRRGARSAQIRLATTSPESQPSSSQAGTQLTDFSQISAHASGAWRHSHPWSHPLSGIFFVTFLNDTSAPRAREHLRSCLHLSNPCTEPKGSQPN